MKVGLQIPRFTWDEPIAPKLAEIGRTADSSGFASIWVMDHFFQIPPVSEDAGEPMLEGYSTLNYLAAVTERAKLGTLVTGVIYRHPGILVKTATTLDVLSGGRAYLGIGAGWFERESKGLGLPFPSTSERFEWLEETLQIARQMWSDGTEAKPYEGKNFRLDEPISSPAPLSSPHPKIMVGGGGEKKTLKLVAGYADACNLFAFPGALDQLQHKLGVLEGHCDAAGRDYAEVEKTALGTAHLADGEMSAEEIVDFCGVVAELGVDHLIFNMPNVQDVEPLQRFGEEVIPKVSAL